MILCSVCDIINLCLKKPDKNWLNGGEKIKKFIALLLAVLMMLTFAACTNASGNTSKTPYIQDGYWYVEGENTGIKALKVIVVDIGNGCVERKVLSMTALSVI